MTTQRRTFETRGPVSPDRNYVVPRDAELADLIHRLKQGRYVVISAPRQTGKTTFFRWALEKMVREDSTYLPISLNFEIYVDVSVERFYEHLAYEMFEEIRKDFQHHQVEIDERLHQLANYPLSDQLSFQKFLRQLSSFLIGRKVVMIIDEFDGIPQNALRGFLHSLRQIYLSGSESRCPYSLGIVGIRSISQLNYDRSISPFNIQDDFVLSNFTRNQVNKLLEQYTDEVGQRFAPEVIEQIDRQTGGQPFLVNRFAQILTEEMKIPFDQEITLVHFEVAHQQILDEPNVHLTHLTTNIRRKPAFERLLMNIILDEKGAPFNIRNNLISELVSYGVLKRGEDGSCEISNPIYQHTIIQTFQPLINGLEDEYLPEESVKGFTDYLTSEGKINCRALLMNFHDFIKRAGYRILEVPDTPQEFVGQYLLFAYLDAFVRQIRGFLYTEVPTGRGRMDLIILPKKDKYIIETKLWRGQHLYNQGKIQLANYLNVEGLSEGYYVVFNHRRSAQEWFEEELINGKTIVSYCIPVVQHQSTAAQSVKREEGG